MHLGLRNLMRAREGMEKGQTNRHSVEKLESGSHVHSHGVALTYNLELQCVSCICYINLILQGLLMYQFPVHNLR